MFINTIHELSKINMWTAEEVRTFSYGLLHMDPPVQTLKTVERTCQKWWMIRMDGEKESGDFIMMIACLDSLMCTYLLLIIKKLIKKNCWSIPTKETKPYGEWLVGKSVVCGKSCVVTRLTRTEQTYVRGYGEIWFLCLMAY